MARWHSPSYDQGDEFDGYSAPERHSLAEVLARDPERFARRPMAMRSIAPMPGVRATSPRTPAFSLRTQAVTWLAADGRPVAISSCAEQGLHDPVGVQAAA